MLCSEAISDGIASTAPYQDEEQRLAVPKRLLGA